ncbi:recombinase family protein [Cryobacterium cheniae]|uniref:Recombinase family protein n=1 Tax=Cryobacterium cheniae TaxID=1259262 RepID=A0A4R8XXN0_9MICO|nr:recombinase family protein [Cryobacterium cheniae]TFC83715.1 recombinase family protein [Cryobacterium cheniae]
MTPQSTKKTFGYIRVSTVAQNLDRQTDALVAQGIHASDIFSDKLSGARQSRPGLDALLRVVRPGDTITVQSLDRLGRTALHVLQTIADLHERDIAVRSLKDGEDLTSTTGRLLAGIIVHIAEWERNMNAERVAEARAARASRAQAGEQVAGRPRTALTPAKVEAVRRLRESGMSPSAIAANQGISRASVYRALEHHQ